MVKLDHLRIAVKDWRASRDWYCQHLGLRLEFELANGGDARLGVAAMQDDAGLTLFLDQVNHEVHNCTCVLYYQVDSVDALYSKLAASRVVFRRAPEKQYWGYGAELADPDGHIVRIWDETSMHAHET
jgi:catechol 2,3-dioxygenase-like lactoylglutathione lyase family enzyme